MIYMGAAGDRGGRWPRWARRVAAALDVPHAPAVAGALLALAAMSEAIARGAHAGMSVADLVGVGALAMSTTLPLAFLGPLAAAVAICAASTLSLTAFGTMTVAGLAATLIVLYRLGRNGIVRNDRSRTVSSWDATRFLAPALALPFLVIALADTGHAASEERVLVVLLACLAPAAALAGIARQARSEALVHSAARQAVAGTLLEHTARGERARIARELHDVVAHHISMIAVQAETARLATPGMPAAGAQRLLQIGDTARARPDRNAAAARRPARGRRGIRRRPGLRCRPAGRGRAGPGTAGRGPASPAGPAPAQRAGRRGEERRRRGGQADRLRAARHARSRRRTGRVPHRPGSPDQRPQARAGRGGRRGTALHQRRPAAAHP